MRIKCRLCPLGELQADVLPVPPDGPKSASILFLGEAPGENEDRQGRPFVGRAGNILSDLLDKLGLRREQVMVSNVCWCRPPDNRTPLQDEITTCTHHYFWPLIKDMQRLRLIVSLGKPATSFLMPGLDSIYRVAGHVRCVLFGAYYLYPMVHPASTFRSGVNVKKWEEGGDRLKRLLDRDFFDIRRHHGPRKV